MCKFYVLLTILLSVTLAKTVNAQSSNVLIENNSWGSNAPDQTDMSAVFGSSNYTLDDYTVNASSVFTSATKFVFIEGGDGQEANFQNFLTANQSHILNWVQSGGNLLLEDAGWSGNAYTFGPGTIGAGGSDYSLCGTLTAAGAAGFIFVSTPTAQCGFYLSHDDITGTGLTDFMTANSGYNVAGTAYGSGYIMYSGLTTSDFHFSGDSLNEDVIAYTDHVTVPEGGSTLLYLLLSGVAMAAGVVLRRKINNLGAESSQLS